MQNTREIRDKLGEWIQHAFHLFSCANLQENLFIFVCLWWVRSERWERRREGRTRWTESALEIICRIIATDSCVWQHIQLLIWAEELCILKAGLRTMFRLQIWQMSVVVSAEQKMICLLSSLCALLSLSLSLSLCFPEWWPIQNCSRSHRTEHPSVSTSRPASLCKLRRSEGERRKGFVSSFRVSVCLCLLIATSCKCVSVWCV